MVDHTFNRCREEFEHWCVKQGLHSDRRKDDGRYEHQDTRGAWATWQFFWAERCEISGDDVGAAVKALFADSRVVGMLNAYVPKRLCKEDVSDLGMPEYDKAHLLRYIASATLAYIEPKRESGWLPIDTAPKGEEVWVFQDGAQLCAKFMDYDMSDVTYKIKPANKYKGWLDGYSNPCSPTHWRKKPSDPTQIEVGSP